MNRVETVVEILGLDLGVLARPVVVDHLEIPRQAVEPLAGRAVFDGQYVEAVGGAELGERSFSSLSR